MTTEERVHAIINSKRRTNRPHPDEPGKRIIGWIVDADIAGMSEGWKADCIKWRGRVLTGVNAHWCYDWGFLPVDETTPEWKCCRCFPDRRANAEKEDDNG